MYKVQLGQYVVLDCLTQLNQLVLMLFDERHGIAMSTLLSFQSAVAGVLWVCSL